MLRKTILLLVIIICPIISCSRQDNSPLAHKRSPMQNISKVTKPTQDIIAETNQNKLYDDYQSRTSSQYPKEVIDYVQQYQLESKRVPKDNNDLMSEIKEADKIYAQLKASKGLDKSNKHLVKKHKQIKAHAEQHNMLQKKDLSATWKSVSPKKSKKIRKANSNIDHLKLPHSQIKEEPVTNNNTQPMVKSNPAATNHTSTTPVITEKSPPAQPVEDKVTHDTQVNPPKLDNMKKTIDNTPTDKSILSAPKVPAFPSSSMIEHKTDFSKIFNFDNFFKMIDNLKNKLINFFVSLI